MKPISKAESRRIAGLQDVRRQEEKEVVQKFEAKGLLKKRACMGAGGLIVMVMALWLLSAPGEAQLNPLNGTVKPPWWWNNTTAAADPHNNSSIPANLNNSSGLEKLFSGLFGGPWGVLGGPQKEFSGLMILFLIFIVTVIARMPIDAAMAVMFVMSIVLPSADLAPWWFYGIAVVLAALTLAAGLLRYYSGGGGS